MTQPSEITSPVIPPKKGGINTHRLALIDIDQITHGGNREGED